MSIASSDDSNEHAPSLLPKLSSLQRRIEELEAENEKLRSSLLRCKCTQLRSIAKTCDSSSKWKHDPTSALARSAEISGADRSTNGRANERFVALKIMYFGKRFHGFASDAQIEPTVESAIFEALEKTKLLIANKKEAQYSRCGRTDKGVSSVGQVVALYLRSKLREPVRERICMQDYLEKEIDYPRVINRALPDDIRVLGWSPVSDNFNARFSCISREYRYFFWKKDLDLMAMESGGRKFLGEHDFRNFCKMDAQNVHNYKRRVTFFSVCALCKRADGADELCAFTIKGSAFLWHQVRCMVAVLFMIGRHLESPDVIDALLDVEITPKKPQYAMAPEVPLVLRRCEFKDVNFVCSSEARRAVEAHLEEQYAACELQAAIFRDGVVSFSSDNNGMVTKRKAAHVPLLSRPTEPSYTERRAKIERQLCTLSLRDA